jgi:UDP-N-acetylglucosamine--N-acetylmuramyl-(pentapeptide) pyrophosphoryl-undecaprenol N-acetylglucosamine transferase
VVDQQYLADLEQEVRDTIFNDWLLRKFRENLHRMERANSLEVVLDDLESLVPARAGAPPGRLTGVGADKEAA